MKLLRTCLVLAVLALTILAVPMTVDVLDLGGIALASGSTYAIEPVVEGSPVGDLGALSTAVLVFGVAILLAVAIWWLDRMSRRRRGEFDTRLDHLPPSAFRLDDPG